MRGNARGSIIGVALARQIAHVKTYQEEIHIKLGSLFLPHFFS